jgi:hypothetical protein
LLPPFWLSQTWKFVRLASFVPVTQSNRALGLPVSSVSSAIERIELGASRV